MSPVPRYRSTKKMFRLAIRVAAAQASFGALAFATPNPAHPLRFPVFIRFRVRALCSWAETRKK